MCLTLSNAAAIHHHIPPGGTAVRGYTSTAHHAGHLTPGDQWRTLTGESTALITSRPPQPSGLTPDRPAPVRAATTTAQIPPLRSVPVRFAHR